MTQQLRALLGSIGHGVRQIVGSILGFVGLRALDRFAVPALVGILAIGAAISARDTAAILNSRPEVTEATLPEVAGHTENDDSVWYAFDALIDASSFATEADLGTFFYLARDPANIDQGLLIRSPLNDTMFRRRVLTATLVEDRVLIEEAMAQFGPLPTGYAVDDVRYLDETDAGGEPDQAFEPSELDGEAAGTNALVHGRVVAPARFATPDGDAWLYLLADVDGGSALVLRSPHPPDALPVRLQGLFQRESFDLAPVLESDWFASIDAEVPTERALRADYEPPIMVEASWVPTIVYAVLAALLLASHLVGYPVFGRGSDPGARRAMVPGEGIDVALTGRVPRDRATLHLDGSPGAVERLSVDELALRMWRYGLLSPELSRRDAERRYVEEAGGVTDRLVVHERDQSALVIVDRGGGGAVAAGRLHRVGRSAPAVRFRQGPADVYLTTRSDGDRDRVAAEIAGELAGSA
jgi:hypothetical protein